MKNDQTKKKILALIMSMTIAAGLAGCAPKNANVPINAADAAIVNDVVKLNNDSYYTENKSQSNLSEKEMKTYLPPEDGWTWEKLSQTIYIDGINYESFNKYGDFKGKYLYDEPYTYEDNATVILSNETAFMAVNFKCGEENEINDETLIKAIAFYKDEKYPEENKNIIVVNGLKIGATIDELISKMGEPTDAKSDKSENRDIKLYNYISDCGYCISFFINNDYISSVTIIFEE